MIARLRRYTLVAVLMYSFLVMTMQVMILPETPTTRKMLYMMVSGRSVPQLMSGLPRRFLINK